MTLFNNYLDRSISLEERLHQTFKELRFEKERQHAVLAFLELLKLKDPMTYEHSIRVGLLCRAIGQFMHFDQNALFYAGLLHDVGKSLVKSSTLKKVEAFDSNDYKEIMHHVKDGYRMLQGYFDFTAEIILWHHRFQPNKYPKNLPGKLHEYGDGTKVIIQMYGRIVSIADCFDALHRVNKKHKDHNSLNGEQIKEKMLEINPDQKVLIYDLYQADILTTTVIN